VAPANQPRCAQNSATWPTFVDLGPFSSRGYLTNLKRLSGNTGVNANCPEAFNGDDGHQNRYLGHDSGRAILRQAVERNRLGQRGASAPLCGEGHTRQFQRGPLVMAGT
jgi:hypothetical protein